MAWEYSEKTKQLFMDAVHGKPGTHLGEIEDPDGMGEHGSIACGDAMRFTFRVERHPTDPTKDVITEARYLTFGCTSAIAASEALCTLIEQGRYTPIEALKIQNKDIVEYLEGLPRQKIHCSVMGAEALEAAVFNWAQKRGVDLAQAGRSTSTPTSRTKAASSASVSRSPSRTCAARSRNSTCGRSPRSPTRSRRAGRACRATTCPAGCRTSWTRSGAATAKALRPLTQISPAANRDTAAAGDGQPLSPYQFSKKVEKDDRRIRPPDAPARRRRRGDRRHQGHAGLLPLPGACPGCAGASQTLRMIVEQTLKDMVDERIRVIQV